jgi:hypothetical protein
MEMKLVICRFAISLLIQKTINRSLDSQNNMCFGGAAMITFAALCEARHNLNIRVFIPEAQ